MWGEAREEVILSFGVPTTVLQAEMFVILACAKECIGRAYTCECIYI
jgi:hypothetical protein